MTETPLIKDIKDIEKNIDLQIKKDKINKTGDNFFDILHVVAHGTPLRTAIEKIARARTGGLIVISNDDALKLIRGGFNINVKFTTARAAELSKMDGAVILDKNVKRILYAASLLVPSGAIKTNETGARHQAAERTARQTGSSVIAVSQRTGTSTLYFGDQKRWLKEIQELFTRTRETLASLERHRKALDENILNLSIKEIAEVVKVRDVVAVLQRSEAIFRIEKLVQEYLTEMGKEGEFLEAQFKELVKDVEKDFAFVIKDYKNISVARVRKLLEELSQEHLLDLTHIMGTLGYASLDEKIYPRGYRFLNKVPSLSQDDVKLLVKKMGFKKLLNAGAFDFTVFKQLANKRTQIADEIKKLRENLILKIKN